MKERYRLERGFIFPNAIDGCASYWIKENLNEPFVEIKISDCIKEGMRIFLIDRNDRECIQNLCNKILDAIARTQEHHEAVYPEQYKND